jgi:tetratricopeptide (TPR) repeat protein
LIIAKDTSDGIMRFRMLEVVREYALEFLEKSGEAEETRQNHATYYLALAEKAEPHVRAAQSTAWLNRLEEEYDNLHVVLIWSAGRNTEITVRLTSALTYYWLLRGHYAEGRQYLETALNLCIESASLNRWKLLIGAGKITRSQGDFQFSGKFFEESLRVAEALKDKFLIEVSNRHLGLLALMQNDITKSREYLKESLTLGKQLNNKIMIAISVNALGEIARAENDYEKAEHFYEEALTALKETGSMEGIGVVLNNLAAISFHKGNYLNALQHYTEALMTGRKLGYKVQISYSLDGFAALAAHFGDSECAAVLAGAAENLRESIGHKIEPSERKFREVYLSELRDAMNAMGKAVFASAYERGRKLKLDEAIDLALSLARELGEFKENLSLEEY